MKPERKTSRLRVLICGMPLEGTRERAHLAKMSRHSWHLERSTYFRYIFRAGRAERLTDAGWKARLR